jgi:hypothetical protein
MAGWFIMLRPVMDPLHLCIALGPLAVYLFLLGIINLLPRPFLTNGSRDTAALGIAISGFIVAGPMELFLPDVDSARMGSFVWVLLLGLYVLLVALLILSMRPRLIIYNMNPDQLRPVLAELVAELDPEARWSRDTLLMPKLHVQLCVETQTAMRNVQLVAMGRSQSHLGWRRLERHLAAALAGTRTSANPYGISFVGFALLLMGIVTYWMAADRHAVAQSLIEMFGL